MDTKLTNVLLLFYIFTPHLLPLMHASLSLKCLPITLCCVTVTVKKAQLSAVFEKSEILMKAMFLCLSAK